MNRFELARKLSQCVMCDEAAAVYQEYFDTTTDSRHHRRIVIARFEKDKARVKKWGGLDKICDTIITPLDCVRY